MWKDVLVIVVAIIAVLTWIGLTPTRIAQLARRYITPNRLVVSLLVTLTVGAIYASIVNPLYRGESLSPGIIAGFLLLCFIIWRPIIDYYFSPQSGWGKAILFVQRLVPIPVVALLWMELDDPTWYKASLLVGGFLGGVGLGLIEDYIRKWRSHRREQYRS